jgi:hypothetical protein
MRRRRPESVAPNGALEPDPGRSNPMRPILPDPLDSIALIIVAFFAALVGGGFAGLLVSFAIC